MTERLNLLSYRRNLRRRSTSKSDYTRWRGPSGHRAKGNEAGKEGATAGHHGSRASQRSFASCGRDPGVTRHEAGLAAAGADRLATWDVDHHTLDGVRRTGSGDSDLASVGGANEAPPPIQDDDERDHLVPLSAQAIDVIKALHKLTGLRSPPSRGVTSIFSKW
jgi:hypothetical protein